MTAQGTVWAQHGEPIDFCVGRDLQRFQIHANDLRKKPSSFIAVIDAGQKTISLQSQQPAVFQCFLQFYKNNKIYEEAEGRHGKPRVNIPYLTICEAWVFGEKFEAPSFQNACLRAWLVKRADRNDAARWDLREITYAYARTERGSPLRRFLAFVWARGYPCDKLPFDRLPAEFSSDLVQEMAPFLRHTERKTFFLNDQNFARFQKEINHSPSSGSRYHPVVVHDEDTARPLNQSDIISLT